jgi:hypothetical protein
MFEALCNALPVDALAPLVVGSTCVDHERFAEPFVIALATDCRFATVGVGYAESK